MKDLKIFAKTIEPQAQAQIDLLLAQKPFEDCKVRIMPDVHAGADQWVYVGDDWINHTSNTAAMIKEVCGSYPSEWNGKRCADMYPVLMQGASRLCLHPKRYRQFEPGNCWGTVESTAEFLRQIADNCDKFPTAVIEVDC